MLILMVASFIIAGLWTKVPAIGNTVHFILDPTAGKLLGINMYLGMTVIVLLFTLATTLVQKYGTDQEELRKLKAEQKALQEEAKKYRDHPEKLLEFNKKQMEMIPKTFDLTMKPLIYTFIPFVLFFRWFSDFFLINKFEFFGFMSWFWFYLLGSIVLSMILRKIFKVV